MYRKDEVHILWYRMNGDSHWNPTLYASEAEMRETEANLNPDKGQAVTQSFGSYVDQADRIEVALNVAVRNHLSESKLLIFCGCGSVGSWLIPEDWSLLAGSLAMGLILACAYPLYLLQKRGILKPVEAKP